MAGSMAQMVECLPSKPKTLNSNSSTDKKIDKWEYLWTRLKFSLYTLGNLYWLGSNVSYFFVKFYKCLPFYLLPQQSWKITQNLWILYEGLRILFQFCLLFAFIGGISARQAQVSCHRDHC
jgi:hypothetical protein